MSEFRFNRVTGDWVIIASERARRPEDYIIRMNRRDMPPHVSTCPFCVGNEYMTDSVFIEPANGAWKVRVIKNKFPALRPDANPAVEGGINTRTMSGLGYHEVLIEHAEHNRYLFDQNVDEMKIVLASLKRRYVEIAKTIGSPSSSYSRTMARAPALHWNIRTVRSWPHPSFQTTSAAGRKMPGSSLTRTANASFAASSRTKQKKGNGLFTRVSTLSVLCPSPLYRLSIPG